jgi:hypothetical protein
MDFLASHSAQPLLTPSSASLRRAGPPFLVAAAVPPRPSAGALAGAARAGMWPSTTDTRLDAEVDAWNKWVPGMSVLVWYSADDVWHERLLIWPGLKGGWQVLTPEDDFYLEVLLPDGSGDVARVIALPDNNSLPVELVEQAYMFAAYPGQDRFKALLQYGKKEVDAYYGPRSVGLQAPAMVLTPRGVRKPLADFFGGSFLTRQLRVKKNPLAVGILVEPVPTGPHGVPPPAGSPSGISSWPNAFRWQLPHLGSSSTDRGRGLPMYHRFRNDLQSCVDDPDVSPVLTTEREEKFEGRGVPMHHRFRDDLQSCVDNPDSDATSPVNTGTWPCSRCGKAGHDRDNCWVLQMLKSDEPSGPSSSHLLAGTLTKGGTSSAKKIVTSAPFEEAYVRAYQKGAVSADERMSGKEGPVETYTSYWKKTPPLCEVCGTYAKVPFAWCRICQQERVRHHGRCCPARFSSCPSSSEAAEQAQPACDKAASDEAAAAATSGSLPAGSKGTKGKPTKRGKPLLAPAPEDP